MVEFTETIIPVVVEFRGCLHIIAIKALERELYKCLADAGQIFNYDTYILVLRWVNVELHEDTWTTNEPLQRSVSNRPER